MPESKANNPLCYSCKYRGDIPGDAHSVCNHPLVKKRIKESNNGLLQIMSLLGVGIPIAIRGIIVRGNSHGIRNGWFNWPFNFDPSWLEKCTGYNPLSKDKDENAKAKAESTQKLP